MFHLAWMYQEGIGVEPNSELSTEYLYKAAEAGWEPAIRIIIGEDYLLNSILAKQFGHFLSPSLSYFAMRNDKRRSIMTEDRDLSFFVGNRRIIIL